MSGSSGFSGRRGWARVIVRFGGAPAFRRAVPPEGLAEEEERRLRRAAKAATEGFLEHSRESSGAIGSELATILEAHGLIASDGMLLSAIVAHMRKERVNCEWALAAVAREMADRLELADASAMRERAADIMDVAREIARQLSGGNPLPDRDLPRGSILVADELSPADAARLDPRRVRAILWSGEAPQRRTRPKPPRWKDVPDASARGRRRSRREAAPPDPRKRARPVRRVAKPWGHEIVFAENERYAGKILHIEPGHSLSLQYHERKDETLFVLREVTLSVEIEGAMREIRLLPGQSHRIRPGSGIWMSADAPVDLAGSVFPWIDDVVRLEDRYGRAGNEGAMKRFLLALMLVSAWGIASPKPKATPTPTPQPRKLAGGFGRVDPDAVGHACCRGDAGAGAVAQQRRCAPRNRPGIARSRR